MHQPTTPGLVERDMAEEATQVRELLTGETNACQDRRRRARVFTIAGVLAGVGMLAVAAGVATSTNVDLVGLALVEAALYTTSFAILFVKIHNDATPGDVAEAHKRIERLGHTHNSRAVLFATLAPLWNTQVVSDTINDVLEPNMLERAALDRARPDEQPSVDAFERANNPVAMALYRWLWTGDLGPSALETERLICRANDIGPDVTRALASLLHVLPRRSENSDPLLSLAAVAALRLGPLDGGLDVFDGLAHDWDGPPPQGVSHFDAVSTPARAGPQCLPGRSIRL
jgi:hypothetical protein